MYQLLNGDCLELMKDIPDGSIDMILCDLPYGTTECKWDSIIPLDKIWEEYGRIIKEDGVIALTSAQPFTSKLISSNIRAYRYSWYWIKNMVTGFAFAKSQPLRKVEEICIFYKKKPMYNAQGLVKVEKPKVKYRTPRKADPTDTAYSTRLYGEYVSEWTNYPTNVLNIKVERGLHPTQKPIELCEYLIKTYTHEGMTILDNCMGSGTTGVACMNTNRRFIGMELNKHYFNVATKRIEEAFYLAQGEEKWA